jgi:hypothetical protein
MSQVIIKRKGVTLADVIDELLEINVIGYGHDCFSFDFKTSTISIRPNYG